MRGTLNCDDRQPMESCDMSSKDIVFWPSPRLVAAHLDRVADVNSRFNATVQVILHASAKMNKPSSPSARFFTFYSFAAARLRMS